MNNEIIIEENKEIENLRIDEDAINNELIFEENKETTECFTVDEELNKEEMMN
ncbi:hypothetical protein LUQ84_000916 [Hamiltosporidium tvaerminnensis]|nr:hypothetical protein LUQ84_000916 [Hamiltosporidium tvaerminnensis]